VVGFKRLIDNFQKASNGGVTANLHLGGSLPIAGKNITQAVSENVVQLADDGFATSNIPITAVLRLPMLLLSVSDMLKAMAILRPYLDRDYARKSIVVLGQYGIDPIWFGVLLVTFVELGQISPPIGINPFVIQRIWDGELGDVVLGTIPFHIIMLVLLFLLMVFPQLARWLPGHMS
jgi:TRAP-type C4-dicarboxylate transport system permease large subunit